jgi:hypothetical protein
MRTLTRDGKTWELRPGTAQVLVVPTPEPADPDLPVLHRTDCRTRPDPGWPLMLDAHVPAAIREQTLALWWQVETEHEKDGKPREVLFCEQCMLREVAVY